MIYKRTKKARNIVPLITKNIIFVSLLSLSCFYDDVCKVVRVGGNGGECKISAGNFVVVDAQWMLLRECGMQFLQTITFGHIRYMIFAMTQGR